MKTYVKLVMDLQIHLIQCIGGKGIFQQEYLTLLMPNAVECLSRILVRLILKKLRNFKMKTGNIHVMS